MEQSKDYRLGVRLNQQDLQKLEELAEVHRRTKSDVVRILIEDRYAVITSQLPALISPEVQRG